MPTCLIGLGANLGDRQEALGRAIKQLAQHPEIRLLGVSRWHETRPAGGPANQPAYLNGAATVETTLAPLALLAVLQDVENQLGRRRQQRWEARPVDLDLLLYEDHVEQSVKLTVPHPRMAWRRFVLEPAAEIAPSMLHPITGRSIAQLLDHLNTTPPYVAVTGTVGSANTDFTRRLTAACSADGLFDPAPFDTPGSTDPSGIALAIALECLRRRARLLSARYPRWSDPERWTISDFWFNQSRAWTPRHLAACQQGIFRRWWQRWEHRVVRPKLIVLVDVPQEQLHGETVTSALPRPVRDQLRRALDRQLRRAAAPVLQIDDPRSTDALKEVAAAIEAMTR